MLRFKSAFNFRICLACSLATICLAASSTVAQDAELVFGPEFKKLESRATGQWWKVKPNKRQSMDLDVPRDQVVAFAVYTHDHGTLKLTAQLAPANSVPAVSTTMFAKMVSREK